MLCIKRIQIHMKKCYLTCMNIISMFFAISINTVFHLQLNPTHYNFHADIKATEYLSRISLWDDSCLNVWLTLEFMHKDWQDIYNERQHISLKCIKLSYQFALGFYLFQITTGLNIFLTLDNELQHLHN